MKIRLLSDLHLETGPYTYKDQGEDVVVLAGDIDNGTRGIEWAITIPKPVIYVAGNHEHWGFDIDENIASMRATSAGSNVHFLENDEATITVNGETTVFLGATLWTDFCIRYYHLNGYPELNKDAHRGMMIEAERRMMDYYHITKNGEKIKSEAILDMHTKSADWLENRLKAYSGQRRGCKVMVVTHHAPSYESLSQPGTVTSKDLDKVIKYRIRDDSRTVKVAAYASDLTYMMRHADYWLHGHTHDSIAYNHQNCLVMCNPRGYHVNPSKNVWLPKIILEKARKDIKAEQGDVFEFNTALVIDTKTTKRKFFIDQSLGKLTEIKSIIKTLSAIAKYTKSKDLHLAALALNKCNALIVRYNDIIYALEDIITKYIPPDNFVATTKFLNKKYKDSAYTEESTESIFYTIGQMFNRQPTMQASSFYTWNLGNEEEFYSVEYIKKFRNQDRLFELGEGIPYALKTMRFTAKTLSEHLIKNRLNA